MAVTTHIARRPARSVAVLKSQNPLVRTAKLRANSRGSWEIHYSEPKANGPGWRTKVVSTRTRDYTEAQRFLDQFIERALELENPSVAADQLTVEDVCREYLLSRPQQALSLALVRKHLGHVRIVDITPTLVERFRQAFGGYKNNTLRRRLGALKAAINLARKTGKINVLPYIDLPRPGVGRTVWMTKAQLTMVWDKVQELAENNPGPVTHALKVFVYLAMFGPRREAIRELTWDRVDFEHRTLNFKNPDREETKKRRPICPLNDQNVRQLKEWWLAAGCPVSGRVIAISDDTLKNHFRAFMADLGLPWVTSHVFRHTKATHMLMDGETIHNVALWLADTVDTIEKTYSHVLSQDLRDVAERWRIDA
jgi:integrase